MQRDCRMFNGIWASLLGSLFAVLPMSAVAHTDSDWGGVVQTAVTLQETSANSAIQTFSGASGPCELIADNFGEGDAEAGIGIGFVNASVGDAAYYSGTLTPNSGNFEPISTAQATAATDIETYCGITNVTFITFQNFDQDFATETLYDLHFTYTGNLGGNYEARLKIESGQAITETSALAAAADPEASIALDTAGSEASGTDSFEVTLSAAATADTTLTYTVGGNATSGLQPLAVKSRS